MTRSLFRSLFRSLRLRIQIWNALILAIVISVFGGMLYFQHRIMVLRASDDELRAGVAVLAGKLQAASPRTMRQFLNPDPEELLRRMNRPSGPRENGGPDDPGGRGGSYRVDEISKLDRDLQLPETFHSDRELRDLPYFAIWRSDGLTIKTSSAAIGLPFPELPESGERRAKNIRFRQRGHYREAYATGAPGTLVLVGRNRGPDMHYLRSVAWWISGTGVGAWMLGLAGGWLLSRGSTRPIAAISEVAADISGKNLDGRIDATKMDVEFAGLSRTLNDTFSRLQTAFKRQRQFTADASHELRTPLSVLQTHQQLALSKPRTPEEYRDTLEICQRAVDRMNSLVDSLLVLARVDSNDAAAGFAAVDLRSVIQNEIDKLEPVIARNQQTVSSELQTAVISGDQHQLSRVISNLLTNAINYNKPGGHIQISLRMSVDKAVVEVSDNGAGIPRDEQSKIFDRFYRVNKERSRTTGGSGLGLAICKSIIERHGGSISVESEAGQGSTFRFSIPIGD